MRTTATNKKIRELIAQLADQSLVPNPQFQRRLVWANKHKVALIQTVLDGLPFPEVYIAAGNVDLETGIGQSMLVDGQQRLTTIQEYFSGSPNIRLPRLMSAYSDLPDEKKREFLEYDVVVRDLGQLNIEQVVEIFQRINSTSYSLNAIEVANARFDNELKELAEDVANRSIWDENSVFSSNEIKRMQDVRFALGLIITTMSDYFNRDDQFEDFLIRFNDDFDKEEQVRREVFNTIDFLRDCDFRIGARVWKKADLFTALVEIHRKMFKDKVKLNPAVTREVLEDFYILIENRERGGLDLPVPARNDFIMSDEEISEYYNSALQATNDRLNRLRRGRIIARVLECAVVKE